MKLFFADCCELLAVDAETLSRWLRQAVQDFSLHPGELERKSLSLEQVRYLAAVFDHMRSPLSRSEHPDLDRDLLEEEANGLFFSQTQEISLMKKLLLWEMKITAIQQWLEQISLEFHQECFREKEASCLPAIMNKEQGPDQSNGEQQNVFYHRKVSQNISEKSANPNNNIHEILLKNEPEYLPKVSHASLEKDASKCQFSVASIPQGLLVSHISLSLSASASSDTSDVRGDSSPCDRFCSC